MIVAVLALMTLMTALGLVVSMLGARRADVVAALLGAPSVARRTAALQEAGGSMGGWSERALLRA